jgi:hypothetical protein
MPGARLLASLVALSSAAAFAACSLDLQGSLAAVAPNEAGADATDTDAPSGNDAEATDTGSDGNTALEAGADARVDADAALGPDSAVPKTFVWAHSSTDLYKIDFALGSFTSVPLQGCGALQDLAVHPSGLVQAISTTALYQIGPTGLCTKLFDNPYPFTLSYAAASTVQPQAALVAFEARDYVRFDALGAKVVVKNNALASGFAPSGDVACAGSSCYVSVVGPACADCLQELDATTGNFIKDWGSIGYAKVFGLAYASGRIYGFTDGGVVLEMKLLASGLVVAPVSGMPAVQFIGAGSMP